MYVISWNDFGESSLAEVDWAGSERTEVSKLPPITHIHTQHQYPSASHYPDTQESTQKLVNINNRPKNEAPALPPSSKSKLEEYFWRK